MGRRKVILVSAIVALVLNLLVGFVVPAVAEGIISDRLAQQLSTRFETDVEVTVDVAHVRTLLRGELRSIELTADRFAAEGADGELIELLDLAGRLEFVTVDIGAAVSGDLDAIEVLDGDLRGSLSMDVVEDLVRDGINGGGSFTFVSFAVDGSSFAITLAAPDGTERTEIVRPSVVSGDVFLLPAGSRPDDDAVTRGIRSALSELRVDLPELPLGIEVRSVDRVTPDRLGLLAHVPSVVDLA